MEDEDLRLALRSLSVTRNILQFGPMKKLVRLLDRMLDDAAPSKRIDAYGSYASSLIPYDLDPARAFLSFLSGDLNPYVREVLAGVAPSKELADMLRHELEIIQAAASVSPDAMRTYLRYDEYLPVWKTPGTNVSQEYFAYLETARTAGFGPYRQHHMFILRGRSIVPVEIPDPIEWDSLKGYTLQRNLVKKNTELLVNGLPASNILLYGDSGTGKSSTVKAAANLFASQGVRLIEIRKSQLHRIPLLLESLANMSLKFILFIDDLSFAKEDDDFVALKGILEGSILSQAPNVVVYATSNRRRLIKEVFSDRNGDDIHANETVQQQAALSDRFGLTIPFMNPKKDAYLQIVASIAESRGVDIPRDTLFQGAERFALEKGGRSGRAARQYVEQLPLHSAQDFEK